MKLKIGNKLIGEGEPCFIIAEAGSNHNGKLEIAKKMIDVAVDAGHPCDIEEIKDIAEDHDLYLIEDASHAIGAEYKGKKTGNFADMTIFSFHPVKHITTGEGGAVVTSNEEFYEKLQMLRNHGIDKSALERFGPKAGWAYDLKFLGRNYRITDFQAALGISQLKKLDVFIRRREEIVGMYNEAFEDMPEIETPVVKPYVKPAWHIYTVLLNGINRDEFFNKMRERNIGVNLHYIPTYRFSYYQEQFDISPTEFPVTEEVFRKIVTLPLFSKMTEDEVLSVIAIVKELGTV